MGKVSVAFSECRANLPRLTAITASYSRPERSRRPHRRPSGCQKMKSKKVKSTLILLLTAIIWGFAFVAQRAGSEHVGSFTYNAVRFAVGALSLVPVILIFERGKSTPEQRKRTVMYGVIAGVVLFSAANLQQFGILFTQSAGKSAFITGLYTVLVPIVYAFCGKKTGINVWIGAALTVGGLYLLCGSYGSLGLGDLLLFIGTAFWTAHIITLDRAGHGVRAIRFSCIQFSVCAILGFICAFIFEEVRLDAIRAAAVPILYGLPAPRSAGRGPDCRIDRSFDGIGLGGDRRRAYPAREYDAPCDRRLRAYILRDRAFADRDRTKEEPGRRLTKRRTKDEIRKKRH